VPGHWFSETREEKTSGLRYLNAWHQAPPIPAAGFIFKGSDNLIKPPQKRRQSFYLNQIRSSQKKSLPC
jgi:hypothetical protein